MMLLQKFTGFMIYCLLLAGCALPKVPLEHTLSVDRDGDVDLYEDADSAELPAVACGRFHNLQNQIELISRSVGESDQERILIFIHGGLNLRSKSRERVLEQLPLISAAEAMEQDRYYPIFINWRSGPLSTYAEQTFQIRDGRKEPVWGPVTSPSYLFKDLVSSVASAPNNYGKQTIRLARTGFIEQEVEGLKICGEYPNTDAYAFNSTKVRACFAGTDRSFLNNLGSRALFTVTTPFKVVSTPFAAGLGRTSWDGMLRRTQTLFNNPLEFSMDNEDSCVDEVKCYKRGSGAVSLLMDRLAREHKNKTVTLIGHSMGAIILDEVLRRFTDLNVDRIVYMAPASRIRDTVSAVVPFLEQNQNTEFHILPLHPDAEAREISALGTVPSGSLLEWIDEMYGVPLTPIDRTAGKWENLRTVLHLFPECTNRKDETCGDSSPKRGVAERVHIKVFGFDEDNNMPTGHGDFSDSETGYWRECYSSLVTKKETCQKFEVK